MVLTLACVGAASAPAAELSQEGPRLVVTGLLDGSASREFVDQLGSGTVRTVVFVDSFGGTAEAAESYARAIRSSGVSTEAIGQCHAACAWAFLAGKEHRFGRGPHVNGLLIPLATRPKAGEAKKLLNDITTTTGTSPAPAMPAAGVEVVSLTTPSREKEVWQPDQGVLFSSTPTLFGRVYKTFYCDGTQGRDVSKCEVLSDADPYKLGVLTP
ncbi:hypothetical protein AX767_12855 [Variovorax sp. PAMC 28711]|nr:hypothetical protein AX767_12855 [Variovorax sp. PAMC 28711]